MTNNITLDNKKFQFQESFLPCIIMGADKSGASYFSISLIANLVKNGSKIIFFTAFPMAKEQLFNQVGHNKTFEVTDKTDINNIPPDKTIIINSGDRELWEETIKTITNIEEYIIFVKNIEEYDKSMLNVLSDKKKIVLSGDLNNCSFKPELLNWTWNSKIVFTLPEVDLQVPIPNLKKHESYLISDSLTGILRIE